MSRKRFVKFLMGISITRDTANWIARKVNLRGMSYKDAAEIIRRWEDQERQSFYFWLDRLFARDDKAFRRALYSFIRMCLFNEDLWEAVGLCLR